LLALTACQPQQPQENVKIGETASGEAVYGQAPQQSSSGIGGFLMGTMLGQAIGSFMGNKQAKQPASQMNQQPNNQGKSAGKPSGYDSNNLNFRGEGNNTDQKNNSQYRQVDPQKQNGFGSSNPRSGGKSGRGRRR
jgi:hypothetical protein